MTWLLHSKLFKENLKKWLFMYIAVMCLLTSVITYSKYISNFQGSGDSVRSAKFNLKIDSNPVLEDGDTCTTQGDKKACTITSKRPTQIIEFTVDLDPSELEVATEVSTRFAIKDGMSYEIVLVRDENSTLYEKNNNDSGKTSFVATHNFNASSTEHKSYTVGILYINNDSKYNTIDVANVLEVGYTATQIN